MNKFISNIGDTFNLSKSDKNMLYLKRKIANSLSTRKSCMFDTQGVLRVHLEILIFHININTNETTTRAYVSHGGIATYINVTSSLYILDRDGQTGISKDEIYKMLFE